MARFDRTGRFRGRPTQGVIEATKNGFPQFVVRLEATEMWDEVTKSWVDWSDYDMSITAYLVLFNATKALMNYDQVMKAFNWDGTDMLALQNDDFEDLQVQFEIEENEYNGATSLRVNWIDAYDSLGGRGGDLTPSDPTLIKSLNAQYKQFMRTAPKIAPAAAPAAAPAVKPGKAKTKAKTKVKTQGPPPMPSATFVIDQIGAWTKLNEVGNGTDVSGQWLSAIAAVSESDNVTETDFTNIQWGNVLTIASAALQSV